MTSQKTIEEQITKIINEVAESNFWNGVDQGGTDYAGEGYMPYETESIKELTSLIKQAQIEALEGFAVFIEKRNSSQIVDDATDESIGYGIPSMTYEEFEEQIRKYKTRLEGGDNEI